MEQQVLSGLLSRGIPQHIAKGMVANMIAESGLNPGINEIKPLIPGSRGGFGLNQWTGPRRRAFEAFAQERGRPLDDLDTQLDFTVYELQGPEAKAWGAIQQASDPIEAARLYSERFLRPGIPNMNKRLGEAARLAGMPAPQGGQTVQRSTMNAPPGLLGGSEPKPTFWDKIPGGLLSDPDRRARLAMAFEGMTLNPNQALIGALSEDVKDRRQTKAQEKAMNATVEWLKSQGRDDLAAAVSSGALTGSQAAQMAYQRPDPMEALNLERAQLEIEALRNPQATPMSGIGKLSADLAAGRITQEEYDVALANMAPPGMAIESDGAGGFRMVQGPGAGTSRPMTEGQSKDNVYATRAEGALRALEPVANALTSAGERALNVDPTGIVRNLQSDDFQVAQNAGNEFLQAILRKDTGAAITAQEQELYGQTYLPQPGDNAAVLEVKRQARARALEALRAGMNAEQIATTERALVEAAKRSGASPSTPAPQTGAPTRRRYNPETGALE